MVKPSDLSERREQQAQAEHLAVFGEARDDAVRLYDHFVAREGVSSESAAILTLATILAVPEGEPYA
ncbi:hypothetical protein [Corynebacterium coyleae]|uniref:hypothetical protein n=1 Tax=Corynebacterium coyleae TaxID=53374 RepID=UPI002550B44F|nr:hypothetical protein [Corynebacterium coyleae]MDK8242534.1 hypothetical protein [Corynebacterium coyleae]